MSRRREEEKELRESRRESRGEHDEERRDMEAISDALDALERLRRLLTEKGVFIQELPDAEPDKYHFVLKSISTPQVILGTFICEKGDIPYRESIHSKPGSVTRSAREKAENNDRDLDAIHLRWISITEGNQGKGYGVLLFMYGILSMIPKYDTIEHFYLEDCSDNIGDFINSLYYKCGIIMNSEKMNFISDDPELKKYLKQRQHEIAKIEETRQLRKTNPNTILTSVYLDESDEEYKPSGSESGEESGSESDEDYETEYNSRDPERPRIESNDINVGNRSFVLERISGYITYLTRKILATKLTAKLPGTIGGRRTLKKRRRTIKKGGKTNRRKTNRRKTNRRKTNRKKKY